MHYCIDSILQSNLTNNTLLPFLIFHVPSILIFMHRASLHTSDCKYCFTFRSPIVGLILSSVMVVISAGAATGISVADDLGMGIIGGRDPNVP